MSDFQHYDYDKAIDDVLLLDRGMGMMRALFSNPAAFGHYARVADRYIWKPDKSGTVQVQEWDERYKDTIQGVTVFVRVGDISVGPQLGINDESVMINNGADTHYTFHETCQLTFRVVSKQSAEVLLLSRLILNYALGFKDVLKDVTRGQVIECRPVQKTSPRQVKTEDNSDNLWGSDVVLSVKWQSDFTMTLVSPVLSEVVTSPTVMDINGDVLIQS